uniref:Endo/exonuclease/phosphatase domain-containing protein n=1 Tax=Pristionchus pacificus TaxID=54126 RepID=A0A8R1URC0_PRIPA
MANPCATGGPPEPPARRSSYLATIIPTLRPSLPVSDVGAKEAGTSNHGTIYKDLQGHLQGPPNPPKPQRNDQGIRICSLNCRTLASDASIAVLEHSIEGIRYDVSDFSSIPDLSPLSSPTPSSPLALPPFAFTSAARTFPASPSTPPLRQRHSRRDRRRRLSRRTPKSHFYCVVAGDFNTRVSPRRDGDFRSGPFHSDPHDDHEDLLGDLLSATRTFHGNSFFEKKLSTRWTWEAPGGGIRLEIDHALANRRWMLQDVSVVAGFPFPYSRRQLPRTTIDPIRYEDAIKSYAWTTDADPSKDYALFCTGLKECARDAEVPPVPPPPRLSERARFWIQERGRCHRDPTSTPFQKIMASRCCRAFLKEDIKEHRIRVLTKAAEEKRSIEKAK